MAAGRRSGSDHAAPGGPGSAAAAGSEEWWGCQGGEECLLEGHTHTHTPTYIQKGVRLSAEKVEKVLVLFSENTFTV